MKLCLNLAFSCSLRIGELLALTWDCVDVTDESIATGKASIFINKELQRVKKATMSTLESKDIIFTFPEQGIKNSTTLVLKKPKTVTSTRKVFLPKTVAEMLVAWKLDQYSHILDENRRTNAQLIEKAFYAGKGSEPEGSSENKKAEEKETAGDQESMNPEQLANIR